MKKYFPLVILSLFILVSGCLFLFVRQYPAYDLNALLAANGVLAFLVILGYLMIRRQLKGDGAHAFVRGVYSATLLKLMVSLGGIFAYAIGNKEHLHKPTVFLMLGLYFLYTIVETAILSGVVKKSS
jgi:hypothetical protein